MTIEVSGTPAPKGSSRAITVRGRGVLVPNSSTVNARQQRAWHKAVKQAAIASECIDGPVVVGIAFRLARPKGHYGKRGLRSTAPLVPAVRPDIDKLARCTLDALTGLAFADDSCVVHLTVSKNYTKPGDEGAIITVDGWGWWSTGPGQGRRAT